jgi:hypothetical protein
MIGRLEQGLKNLKNSNNITSFRTLPRRQVIVTFIGVLIESTFIINFFIKEIPLRKTGG